MSTKKENGSQAGKKAKRVPLSEKNYDADPSYWGMPLWERACMRVLYAFMAFICVSSFFDVATGAPMWMQIAMGACVALAVLLFRMAYPKGFGSIWEWVMEGMAEAAEDMESKGKTPKMSSSEIKKALAEQREFDRAMKSRDSSHRNKKQ